MTISEYHRLVVEALAAEPDEVVLIELAKQAQQLSDIALSMGSVSPGLDRSVGTLTTIRI